MSWTVGILVGVGVLVAWGPGGRSAVRVAAPVLRTGHVPTRRQARRPRWRPGRHQGDADLATAAIEVAARLRAGGDPASAWQAVLGVRLAPGVALTVDDLAAVAADRAQAAVVVAAGRLATELGAPLAQLLDDVAREIAAEAEVEGERRAAMAGPRATARILTWLPVLGVVLGTAVGADPVDVLLDGGVGSAALACGVLLLWAGRLWTRRLAASAAAAGRAT